MSSNREHAMRLFSGVFFAIDDQLTVESKMKFHKWLDERYPDFAGKFLLETAKDVLEGEWPDQNGLKVTVDECIRLITNRLKEFSEEHQIDRTKEFLKAIDHNARVYGRAS